MAEVNTWMGTHPVKVEMLQSMENQVCPKSKTGAPVAPKNDCALIRDKGL